MSQHETAEFVKVLTVITIIFSPVGLASSVLSTQVFPQNVSSFAWSLFAWIILVGAATVVLFRFPKWWHFIASLIWTDDDHGTTRTESGTKAEKAIDRSPPSHRLGNPPGGSDASTSTSNSASRGLMGMFSRRTQQAGMGMELDQMV